MGLTFDTGALIGLERARHHMRKVFDVAVTHDVRITVPAVVIAEWWRFGRKEKERARLLRALVVEPVTDTVARLAGIALTLVPSAHSAPKLYLSVSSTGSSGTSAWTWSSARTASCTSRLATRATAATGC